MNIPYHPSKANVVSYAFIGFSLRSTSHVKEDKKVLVEDVHKLSQLGVRRQILLKGMVVLNGAKSSLVF